MTAPALFGLAAGLCVGGAVYLHLFALQYFLAYPGYTALFSGLAAGALAFAGAVMLRWVRRAWEE